MFLLIVVLPTVLVTAYYYVVASNQYLSEAHFVVRGAEKSAPVSANISQALGLSGAMSQSVSDAMGLNDYLGSYNAVDALNKRVDLVKLFNRPEVDPLSRINNLSPSPEQLFKYYRSHVAIIFNADTGISEIRVKAFRPTDSQLIAEVLLSLGEARVNSLNERRFADAVQTSRNQLDEAERSLEQIQQQITRYRQVGNDIDPEGTGKAQMALVATLQTALAQARAQLGAMRGSISPSSPQYVALAAQVRSLQGQVAAESSKLTGGSGSIAQNLSGYQDLLGRQQFATQRYAAASAAFETARQEALKQQLYVIRVVDPNLPVESLYPERGRIVLTVFFSLIVAYGIGWLIVAGIKEHSA